MRKALIAANWKCHGSSAKVDEYATVLEHSLKTEVVVFPPAVFVPRYAACSDGRSDCGVQDLGVAESGAHTGEISGDMVLEVGGRWAILGHSERRQNQKETDALVAAKLAATVNAGLLPILCIGETEQQRDRGEALVVVERQLRSALAGVDGLPAALGAVPCEPIWAIGTGKTCEAAEANRICGLIRSWVGATDLIIQYGGSVKPTNIDELMAMSDIDGVLVGGASLKPDSFARIANYQAS